MLLLLFLTFVMFGCSLRINTLHHSNTRLGRCDAATSFTLFSQNDNISSDEEFELMKASIENLISTNSLENQPNILSSNVESSGYKSNNILALVSSLFGAILFFAQTSQQVSGVALLNQMEKDSVPFKVYIGIILIFLFSFSLKLLKLQVALCNNKPTVIEFYADWCESCKELAPKYRALEFQFKNEINFVTINGAKRENCKC